MKFNLSIFYKDGKELGKQSKAVIGRFDSKPLIFKDCCICGTQYDLIAFENDKPNASIIGRIIETRIEAVGRDGIFITGIEEKPHAKHYQRWYLWQETDCD